MFGIINDVDSIQAKTENIKPQHFDFFTNDSQLCQSFSNQPFPSQLGLNSTISISKVRANKSRIWKYARLVVKLVDDVQKKYIKCNVNGCDYETVYSTTSTFFKHIKNAHNIVVAVEEELEQKANYTEMKSDEMVVDKDPDLINLALMKFIISTDSSLLMSSNSYFTSFCGLLNNSYRPPCIKSITGRIFFFFNLRVYHYSFG
jgi:hypothetical protein